MSDYNEFMEYYKKHWEKSLSERTTEMQEEIKNLRTENARYREALEFYADKSTWLRSPHVDVARQIVPEDCDLIENYAAYCGGRRAREALKGE